MNKRDFSEEPKLRSRVDSDGNYVFENVEEVLRWAVQKSIQNTKIENSPVSSNPKKEEILIEALEFILTYKGPEYFDFYRGSIFEVAREALRKYKEINENI
jgi:hypothetical protein